MAGRTFSKLAKDLKRSRELHRFRVRKIAFKTDALEIEAGAKRRLIPKGHIARISTCEAIPRDYLSLLWTRKQSPLITCATRGNGCLVTRSRFGAGHTTQRQRTGNPSASRPKQRPSVDKFPARRFPIQHEIQNLENELNAFNERIVKLAVARGGTAVGVLEWPKSDRESWPGKGGISHARSVPAAR
jgi:hypothetical protein